MLKTKEETFIELFQDYSIEIELYTGIFENKTNMIYFYNFKKECIISYNIGGDFFTIPILTFNIFKENHKMNIDNNTWTFIKEMMFKHFGLKMLNEIYDEN